MFSPEQFIVLAILLIALVLFFFELVRFDVVAILVVAVLMLAERLGFSLFDQDLHPMHASHHGFADAVIPILACLFVLTRALEKNGFAEVASLRIQQLSRGNELFLLVILIVVVAVLSALINNTAVTAMTIPVVLRCYDRLGRNPRQVYLPLAYASLLGGTLTLIGTSTNLYVNSVLESNDKPSIGMFDMTPAGCVFALVGGVVLVFISRFALRSEGRESLFLKYNVREFLSEILVKPESDVVGRTLQDLHFGQEYDITVVGVVRNGRTMFSPPPTLQVREDDVFMVQGGVESIISLRKEQRLELLNEIRVEEGNLRSVDLVMAEIVLLPNSDFIDQTIRGLDLRDFYGVTILALARQGLQHVTNMADISLRMGDTLLIQGHPAGIERLRRHPNLIVLESVERHLTHRRLPLVGCVLVAMVLSTSLLGSPLELSCLVAVLALLATRCIHLVDVYESIDWRILVLIGGLLPLGWALDDTGTLDYVLAQIHVSDLAAAVGMEEVTLWLGLLLLITIVLTQIITNIAAAALLAPLAITIAEQHGVNHEPFVMAVVFAASFAFMSPMAHQVNLLVMGPGNYRPIDFLRLGVPLTVALFLTAWLIIPWFYPFS